MLARLRTLKRFNPELRIKHSTSTETVCISIKLRIVIYK